jgi:hydrogenase expression/formation protein HypD
VHPGGNATAQAQLARTMQVGDANWRGIGVIPGSGFVLIQAFRARDARLRFPRLEEDNRKRAGQMPPGCDCARVVLGKIYPNACRLYGTACTPHHPIGPCMVSDEGACHIWWMGGSRRTHAA